MKKRMQVGSAAAECGSVAFGALSAAEMPDGIAVEQPVIVINGKEDGPVLYIGAALHGEEVCGLAALRRVVGEIRPQQLAGAIIAVPTQNPLGFVARQRTTLVEESDMNRVGDGNAAGGLGERMMDILVREAMSKAQYAIDLHCGRDSCNLYTIAMGEDAIPLAKAFGMRAIQLDKRESARPTMIAVECGESRRLSEDFVTIDVKGLLNVMKFLKMIPGEPAYPDEQYICLKKTNVRPQHGGLIEMKVKAGDRVKKGQVLAEIFSPYTFEKREQLLAPADGFVSRQQAYPTVHTGERAFHILEIPAGK